MTILAFAIVLDDFTSCYDLELGEVKLIEIVVGNKKIC